jgi:hypothetical protein
VRVATRHAHIPHDTHGTRTHSARRRLTS